MMQSTTRRPGLHLQSSILNQSNGPPIQTAASSTLSTPTPTALPETSTRATASTSTITKAVDKSSNIENSLITMTPQMRDQAMRMLAEGTPPSSLGTVLPSPHPEYLRALYLGPMSQAELFFKTPIINGRIDVNGNDYIIYFDEWSIEDVMARYRAKSLHIRASSNDDQPEIMPDREFKWRTEAVERSQARASRALAQLHTKVHNWAILDATREQRQKEAFEVAVTDPRTRIQGAIENMVDYWRRRLGWIQPAIGYWYNSAAAAIGEQKLKFVAYVPIDQPTGPDQTIDLDEDQGLNTKETECVKYFWDELSGVWQTADGLTKEKEKIRKDRNAWLVNEIGRIERERDSDLIMERVGPVLKILNGLDGHQTGYTPGVWTGGDDVPGEKATRRRKVKKQAPERRYGSVQFVPEDGGLMGLELLREAAAADTAIPSIETEEEAGPERGEKDTEAVVDSNISENEATRKATVGTGIRHAGKRKRQDDQDDSLPPTTTAPSAPITTFTPATTKVRVTPVQPAGEGPPKKKRKATQSKVKKEVEASTATGTRKSTRIAGKKRRTEDETPVPESSTTVAASTKGKKRKATEDTPDPAETNTTKKRKTSTEPPSRKSSRGRTLSAGPATQPRSTPKPTKKRPVLEIITEITEENTPAQHERTTTPLDPAPFSPAILPTATNTSSSTSPRRQETVTPHKPTTKVITSPLPPLSSSTRTSLMSIYPFLNEIPDTPSTVSTTTTNKKPLQTQWLNFLAHFGHGAATTTRLNAFFEQAGSIARAEEFLGYLKATVGNLKRVDDGYCWID